MFAGGNDLFGPASRAQVFGSVSNQLNGSLESLVVGIDSAPVQGSGSFYGTGNPVSSALASIVSAPLRGPGQGRVFDNLHSGKVCKRAQVTAQNSAALAVHNGAWGGDHYLRAALGGNAQRVRHVGVVDEDCRHDDEIVGGEVVIDTHDIGRDSRFPQALVPGLSGREVPPRICGIFRTNRTDRIVACPLALPVNDNCSAGTHASPRNRRQRL